MYTKHTITKAAGWIRSMLVSHHKLSLYFVTDGKTTCVSHTCPWLHYLRPSIRFSAGFIALLYILLFRWDREEGSNKHCGVARASCVPGAGLSASRTSLPYITDGDCSHLVQTPNIQKSTEETDICTSFLKWADFTSVNNIPQIFDGGNRSEESWDILIYSGVVEVSVAFVPIS